MKLKTIFIALILASCAQNQESAPGARKTYGTPFFPFNEVVYYKVDIAESSVFEDPKSKQDTLLREALLDSQPEALGDTTFLSDLNVLPYKRAIIDPKFHKELEHIFSEKDSIPPSVSACIAIYRDILIFKKDKKVTGLAKICFKCQMYHIAGAQANTENFGQWQDYEKLAALLSKQ